VTGGRNCFVLAGLWLFGSHLKKITPWPFGKFLDDFVVVHLYRCGCMRDRDPWAPPQVQLAAAGGRGAGARRIRHCRRRRAAAPPHPASGGEAALQPASAAGLSMRSPRPFLGGHHPSRQPPSLNSGGRCSTRKMNRRYGPTRGPASSPSATCRSPGAEGRRSR
jgi:hypothetical protein